MKFIKKFLFHRFTFLAIAVLAQLLAFIEVILRFNQYFAFFYGGSMLISIVVVLGIINNPMNPAYKIAWIIPILLFPIFGGLFYILFNGNRVNKRTKQKMQSIGDRIRTTLSPQDHIVQEMKLQSETAANQSRYIQNYAYFPPYRNTSSEYLSIGESKFERLKEALKKAEHYIFLEYFIIQEGEMWDSILNILSEKVSKGVEVRLIYDDAGCLFTLPYGYHKKLEALGIKCCVFNPLIPILSTMHNIRDHRKIAIIDGNIGFTGGINLADEYINRFEKHGHWKDSAIMIQGEAVWSLTVMFLSMWEYLRGKEENMKKFKYGGTFLQDSSKNGNGYVQPFADSPLDNETAGEIIYFNIINKAKRYVYITTPYLILNNEMITSLTSAAKGGVDIRIITPHCADKWYVHAVTRSYYKILLESGIKIYEYTPGFIHSKTYVSDDQYGIVGTINMDFRSLYLHFECGVWMYQCHHIIEMKKDFLDTLKFCKEMTMEDVNNIKWYRALGRLILRIFAPLM